MRLAGADTASQMPSMAAGVGQTPPPQHAGRAPSRSAVATVATVQSEAPSSLGASGGSSGSNSSGRGASKLKLAKTCAVAASPPPRRCSLTRGSACRHPGDRYTRASDSEDHSHSNQSAEREEQDDEGSRVRSRDGSAAPPAAAPAAAAQAAPERKKRCLSPTFDDTEPQLSQSQLSQSQPSQPDPLEAEGEGASAAGASEYQDERLSQNDWRSQFGNKSPAAQSLHAGLPEADHAPAGQGVHALVSLAAALSDGSTYSITAATVGRGVNVNDVVAVYWDTPTEATMDKVASPPPANVSVQC